jgi:hypothetical protein
MRRLSTFILVIVSLAAFAASPSYSTDFIRAKYVVWAQRFDLTKLDTFIADDLEPKGMVVLRCQIISTGGNLKCRVVTSTLTPDPGGKYRVKIAELVEHGGRIDMAKTRNAGVGKTIEFAVIVQSYDDP